MFIMERPQKNRTNNTAIWEKLLMETETKLATVRMKLAVIKKNNPTVIDKRLQINGMDENHKQYYCNLINLECEANALEQIYKDQRYEFDRWKKYYSE